MALHNELDNQQPIESNQIATSLCKVCCEALTDNEDFCSKKCFQLHENKKVFHDILEEILSETDSIELTENEFQLYRFFNNYFLSKHIWRLYEL